MTMFKDLDELEIIEKVMELADEFEVVEEPGGYIAYVDGGWLPNVYNSEDEAYREILAYIVVSAIQKIAPLVCIINCFAKAGNAFL